LYRLSGGSVERARLERGSDLDVARCADQRGRARSPRRAVAAGASKGRPCPRPRCWRSRSASDRRGWS
jgi:hypothetical protein